jgi:hypothetical protein
MNSIMKLTAAALGALSIAGGVAVAQDSSTSADDGRAQTANYGTPPGAPLKRDGSLSADPTPATTITPVAADTTSTTTTSTATTVAAPAADTPSPAPAAIDTSTTTADAAPQPRADRN